MGNEHCNEHEVLTKGMVFVVLAEPGAGKTELLAEFGRIWGVAPVRASQFRHRTAPRDAAPLIIDALDEAAKIDQSSLDQIIVAAQEHSNGQVIFACRSYGWEDARTRWVHECFGVEPIVIRIEPFTTHEQKLLFQSRFPEERFESFSQEVERFELTALLGNPQFLRLLADAFVQSDRSFTSKRQIFRSAVEHLAVESGRGLRGAVRPPTTEIVERASAVMAKLLLSEASGVSTRERIGELDYPYLPSLDPHSGSDGFLLLDTKLYKPAESLDDHEPVHRMVAEYCAGEYLVQRINNSRNPLSIRRLLSVIAPNATVRDELRGLLGWMASIGPEKIQVRAIELDAYAVLANGDPSSMLPSSKRLLLAKLAELAAENPGFRRNDYWRRFSVGGFFTEELVEDVRRLFRNLDPGSPMLDLVLELLAGSGGPASLANDIRPIMMDVARDRSERTWALRAIRKLEGAAVGRDIHALIAEGSSASLMMAVEMVADSNGRNDSLDVTEELLRAFSKPRWTGRSTDEDFIMASFYLKQVIDRLSPEETSRHLDTLASQVVCVCGNGDYGCTCRGKASKVVGRLLDRYFEAASDQHDPDRIWRWIAPLWFQHQIEPSKSLAVDTLLRNPHLRRELHRRAFQGVVDADDAFERRYSMWSGHRHAGLMQRDGDDLWLAELAFQADDVPVWTSCWKRPPIYSDKREPDALRARLRHHARLKASFALAWRQKELSFEAMLRSPDFRMNRRVRRHERRAAKIRTDIQADLQENISKVRAGQHWGWIRRFSQYVLYDPKKLTELTEDEEIVYACLRNCLPFLSSHVPTLEQLARHEWGDVARAVFASCWIQFREQRSLDHIERRFLLAARVEAHKQDAMDADIYSAFEKELNRRVFNEEGAAEQFAREFITPGLAGPRDGSERTWWLSHQPELEHLRGTLSVEWLGSYPAMPRSAREELFDLAALHVDRSSLLVLINTMIAKTDGVRPEQSDDSDSMGDKLKDRVFWQVRKFFFGPDDADGWDHLRGDPNLIFEIDGRAGRFASEQKWPALSSEKIYKLLDEFIDVWRPVKLPSSFGSGEPLDQRAWRFLSNIVWRIGRDGPHRCLPVLDRMLADPRFGVFLDALLTTKAEATAKAALLDFTAPTPRELAAMLDDEGVASVEDMRAFLVEQLEELQEVLQTADTNPLVGFYRGERHVDENTARNRIVDRLRDRFTAMNMPIVLEHTMADANRCDFTATAMIDGRRRLLVVEAKGQWHPELFKAASTQLDVRYASYHDAEKQGVYLVFWYGSETKVADRVRHGITSPRALKEKITSMMDIGLRGRLDVFVLDLSRRRSA
ncbi:NACHT domain-containing protein [Agrobacterium cavarae]